MRQFVRSENFILLMMLLLALATGSLIFRDYGESFDEGEIYWYGEYSLNAYPQILHGQPVKDFEFNNLNYYGPAYFMLAVMVDLVDKTLTTPQTWHLLGFLTFLGGSFALYHLARRWMGIPAALGVMILYLTQPLLWGHAFINPKDAPFMTFFLVSITTGLWAFDKIYQPEPTPRTANPAWGLARQAAQTCQRVLAEKSIWRLALFLAGLSALLWLFGGVFEYGISAFIQALYLAPLESLLGSCFARLAPQANQLPVENYLHKAATLFREFRFILTSVSLLVIGLSLLPGWLKRPKVARSIAGLAGFISRLRPLLAKWPILVAGLCLGLTTSIRVLGPLAGVLVTLETFRRQRRKAFAPWLGYALFAFGCMVTAWPFLWKDPLGRLFQSLTIMSSYPWNGPVLFAGKYYPSTNLPWTYLPVLISIQLTEPALLFFLAGCALAFRDWRKWVGSGLLLIVSLWFFIPLAGIILTRRTVYDNFRQLLFLMPPIFLLGGLALDFIFSRLKAKRWALLIILLAAMPGIFGLATLHPYQYIYYNSLVGGNAGAFHRFEMDYWLTSYKDATDFLNKTAPQGAVILVPLGYHLVENARPDLIVRAALDSATQRYDYVVLKAPALGPDNFPDDQTVFSVSRNGATLALVKQSSR